MHNIVKIYHTKIGLEIAGFLVLAFIPGYYGAIMKHDYSALSILVAVTLFIVYLFATTKYTISNTTLQVQSGFLVNKKVDINTITQIKETYNPISSPAASIDRLEVYYNNGSSVIIYPKDKTGFTDHLQAVNPTILFISRNKR